MRHLIVAIVVAAAAILAAEQPVGSSSLLIRGATPIDGSGGPPRGGANVLVRDGRIQTVDTVQAITAATRGAAHAIGVEGTRGTIAPGKVADLLFVDGDPSTDIRNTRRIRYVIKDGHIVQRPAGPRP